MDASAVPIIVAILALLGTAYTQLTSSRATRATAEVAASVELTKIDRGEHERFVTALQADLTRRANDLDKLRARLAGEEERNTGLRGQLQACLDETAALQAALREVRADLAAERRLTADLTARLDRLDIQVEHLRARLVAAGLDADRP